MIAAGIAGGGGALGLAILIITMIRRRSRMAAAGLGPGGKTISPPGLKTTVSPVKNGAAGAAAAPADGGGDRIAVSKKTTTPTTPKPEDNSSIEGALDGGELVDAANHQSNTMADTASREGDEKESGVAAAAAAATAVVLPDDVTCSFNSDDAAPGPPAWRASALENARLSSTSSHNEDDDRLNRGTTLPSVEVRAAADARDCGHNDGEDGTLLTSGKANTSKMSTTRREALWSQLQENEGEERRGSSSLLLAPAGTTLAGDATSNRPTVNRAIRPVAPTQRLPPGAATASQQLYEGQQPQLTLPPWGDTTTTVVPFIGADISFRASPARQQRRRMAWAAPGDHDGGESSKLAPAESIVEETTKRSGGAADEQQQRSAARPRPSTGGAFIFETAASPTLVETPWYYETNDQGAGPTEQIRGIGSRAPVAAGRSRGATPGTNYASTSSFLFPPARTADSIMLDDATDGSGRGGASDGHPATTPPLPLGVERWRVRETRWVVSRGQTPQTPSPGMRKIADMIGLQQQVVLSAENAALGAEESTGTLLAVLLPGVTDAVWPAEDHDDDTAAAKSTSSSRRVSPPPSRPAAGSSPARVGSSRTASSAGAGAQSTTTAAMWGVAAAGVSSGRRWLESLVFGS